MSRHPRFAPICVALRLGLCALALTGLHAGALASTPPPPEAPAPPITTLGQVDSAARVYLGTAQCEFKQQITLTPLPDRPGHFRLQYQRAQYIMVPQETSTGAVRLEDPASGMVWLQIPAKSMLMNSRQGRRVVDACQTVEQRESHPVLQ